MVASVLLAVDGATPEWLTETLRRAGTLGVGRVDAVEQVIGRLTAMWQLIHLRVTYSAGTSAGCPSALLLKLPHVRAGESEASRRFHVLGRSHEVAFYVRVVPAPAMAALPIVRCFDAAHDPEAFDDVSRPDAHVLVEDLSESHWQTEQQAPPPDRCCEEAVTNLAALHAAWWNSDRLRGNGDIARYFAGLHGRAGRASAGKTSAASVVGEIPSFVAFLGDRLSQEDRSLLERVHDRAAEVAAVSSARTETLVHGDPHWWNFLYPGDAAREMGDTTRVLDWGSWRVGAATNDLVHAIAMHWSPARRAWLERPLVQQYHRRLLQRGVTGQPWEALWDDYRRSVLWGLQKTARCWAENWPTQNWRRFLENTLAAARDLDCERLLEK